MSKARKFVSVMLLVIMVAGVVLPIEYAAAEAAPGVETTSDGTTDSEAVPTEGEENIDDEEVPMAGSPEVNVMMFLWAGVAMVAILAGITGYTSYSEIRVKRKK